MPSNIWLPAFFKISSFVVESLLLGKIWICIRLKLLIISSHEIRAFYEVLT